MIYLVFFSIGLSMNSSNITQTQPINPRVVVEQQRRALAEHSSHRKAVKKFRKHLTESLRISLDITDTFIKDSKEGRCATAEIAPVLKLRKVKVSYFNSLIKKDKVNSIINYKKYQTSLNDWLEYSMENLLEGDMLQVADVCKGDNAIIKLFFEYALRLDSKGGYWK